MGGAWVMLSDVNEVARKRGIWDGVVDWRGKIRRQEE